MTRTAAAVAIAALAISCGPKLTESGLNPKDFESEYDGQPTALYTLTNANGMEICLTNFGARLVSVMVPDRNGELRDVVLGFDNIEDYFPENNDNNFGASIGRYANRIAGGRINIAGKEYQLPQNNFGHCLHGGDTGWQYKVYEAVEFDEYHVTFKVVSPDGDNGFPGEVTAFVTYTLTDDNAIDILYEASTTAETIINMANHSYFNLSGEPESHNVAEDILWINASGYTPIDSTFMTTGEILSVAGTPLDFTEPKAIEEALAATDCDQIAYANGVDHNFVLDNGRSDEMPVADLLCPESGIEMIIYTDEPGLQVYSGNFLDGTITGKRGVAYQNRVAICFESQKYPNTPNNPQWPSANLKPGEVYMSHCVYAFAVNGPDAEAEEALEALGEAADSVKTAE